MGAEMMPQPPRAVAPPMLEPKRIKVLGVMDIVFGGLGLLMVLWQVVMLAFQGKLMELSTQGQPDEMVEFQRRIGEETAASSWIGVILGGVVALLILLAGLALVRKSKNAVKKSNLYAWVSIAAKVVSVIVFLAIVNPVIAGALEGIADGGSPEVRTMLNVMKVSMVVGGVLVPVLAAIYPMLCLILLNKPVVKDYLAQHGG